MSNENRKGPPPKLTRGFEESHTTKLTRQIRQTRLAQFYLLVDNVSWLERFLPRTALKFVQLRFKDMPVGEIVKQVQRAQLLCQQHSVHLVVNDYWQIAAENGCQTIHLGQEDLQTADLAFLKKKGMRIGVSTHNLDELARALSLDPYYIAIGPVYETRTKKMGCPPHGPIGVQQWQKHIQGQCPLVAIGGLTVENAPAVYQSGADSVAVISDVLEDQNPEARIDQWLALSRRGIA